MIDTVKVWLNEDGEWNEYEEQIEPRLHIRLNDREAVCGALRDDRDEREMDFDIACMHPQRCMGCVTILSLSRQRESLGFK